MAQETFVDTLEAIRIALHEFAEGQGWAKSDYLVSVEPGPYNDIHVRFAARALEDGEIRRRINEQVWEFLSRRLPQADFARISLFGGSGLDRFRNLHPNFEE